MLHRLHELSSSMFQLTEWTSKDINVHLTVDDMEIRMSLE